MNKDEVEIYDFLLDLLIEPKYYSSLQLITILKKIQREFPPAKKFDFYVKLATCLTNGGLVSYKQRILIMALLFNVSKNNNPFDPLFLHLLDGKFTLQPLTSAERLFIGHMYKFLPKNNLEIYRRTVTEVMVALHTLEDVEFDYSNLRISVAHKLALMSTEILTVHPCPQRWPFVNKLLEALRANEYLELHNRCNAPSENVMEKVKLIPTFILPQLVKYKPETATAYLKKLIESSHDEIINCYKVFLTMETSLSSMKIVQKLVLSAGLPLQFVHLYIGSILTILRNEPRNKKSIMLVKGVCALLKFLINYKIINIKVSYVIIHEAFYVCDKFQMIPRAVDFQQFILKLYSKLFETSE